jgi:hypothetical protein
MEEYSGTSESSEEGNFSQNTTEEGQSSQEKKVARKISTHHF